MPFLFATNYVFYNSLLCIDKSLHDNVSSDVINAVHDIKKQQKPVHSNKYYVYGMTKHDKDNLRRYNELHWTKLYIYQHTQNTGTRNNGLEAHFIVDNTFVNSSPVAERADILADDTFKCIFVNENDRIMIKISLTFVSKGLIDNDSALVEAIADQARSLYLNRC